MSDINLYGLVAALFILVAIAVAVLAVIVVLLVAAIAQDGRSVIAKHLPGPLAAALVGVVCLKIADAMDHRRADDYAAAFPIAVGATWIGVSLLVRRRQRS